MYDTIYVQTYIAILVIFYQYIYAATSAREKHAQIYHISDEE